MTNPMPDDFKWPTEPAITAKNTTFKEAKAYLLKGETLNYLSTLIGSVEVDYQPMEKILGLFTNLVQAKFKQAKADKEVKEGEEEKWKTISVIPRGSFTTRTAIKGHADLDIDVIFPDDYILTELGKDMTLKKALGTDTTGENIIFTRDGVKNVLQYFYKVLVSGPNLKDPDTTKMNDPDVNMTPVQWLKPAKALDTITRSLSVETTQTPKLPSIPIDVFIKVRTKVRGQDIIIGLDKDSLAGDRRFQTTTFIPTQGKWLGDAALSSVDRIALLSLKWWKIELKEDKDKRFKVDGGKLVQMPMGPKAMTFSASKVTIKSHHMLTALNALHELDVGDELYVPTHASTPFTLARVKDVMYKTLQYLNRAYNPEAYTVQWRVGEQKLDYFIPEESYQTMERLYMQARSSWNDYNYLIESNAIPDFMKEIKDSIPIVKTQ